MRLSRYVKRFQNHELLKDMLENETRNDTIIETSNADYKDIQFLNNLNANNTMRCGRHIKNCAL